MKDVIYRFRPVSRLLSADKSSGELDSQYFYFAAPEQLNDPLEGYKHLFFEGDRIVWFNLLKNYLHCMATHCFFLTAVPDETYDLSTKVLDVTYGLPKKFVDALEKVVENFLSEPIVREYVDTWHTLGRASQTEVFNFFDVIHFHALAIVTQTLADLAYIPKSLSVSEFKKTERLDRIVAYTEAYKNAKLDPDGKRSLMDEYFGAQRERHLKDSYAYKNANIPAMLMELMAFPIKYCDALQKAVYPDWYVACFMLDCDDSSIWGSYGGNHRDVCLEFQVENPDVSPRISLHTPSGWGPKGTTWGYLPHPLYEVYYDKEFGEVDFFNSLGELSQSTMMKNWLSDSEGTLSNRAEQIVENPEQWRLSYWDGFVHAATVKVSDWAHEKEYRIIYSSGLFDLTESDMRKLKYDFLSLKGIIFGINTSIEDKCSLIARVEELCLEHKRTNFNFYQAEYNHSTKKIEKIELKTIKVGYVPAASHDEFP